MEDNIKEIVLNQLRALQHYLEINDDMRTDRGYGEKFEDLICSIEDNINGEK